MPWVLVSTHVQGFIQSANMCFPIICLECLWFIHIHFLFHYTIKEGCLYIHLMYLPFHYLSYRKYSSNRSVSCHRVKGLFIIYSFFLGEPTSHKYFLVLINTTICWMFHLLDPFGTHNWFLFWYWNNIQSIILNDGIVFLNHGILPYFILRNLFTIGSLIINYIT